MKFNKIIFCLVVLCVAIPACAQMGGERQTSEVTIKGKNVSINYGSPSINGPALGIAADILDQRAVSGAVARTLLATTCHQQTHRLG